jgi:hypothetical protein
MPDEINETAAIVGIYGEVDRAVDLAVYPNRLAARLEVAQLLPPYRDLELRWYPEFLHWLAEAAEARGEMLRQVDGDEVEGEAQGFPGARTALQELAGATPPRPRMHARRMFAIAVLARALPGMKEPGNEYRELAIQALKAIPGAAERENQAEDLYKVLSGEDQPIHIDPKEAPGTDIWWTDAVQAGISGQVLPGLTGMYPRPCISGMVCVPGVKGPVDALRTEFDNDQINFASATRYLEPLNWQTCRPDFWCTVELLGEPSPGQRRYREVVSSHCGQWAPGGFWAETELLVNFMSVSDSRTGEAAIANYKLAKTPAKSDFILVDEGSLVVAKAPRANTLRITSTKRIKFSRQFPTGWFAMTMCALGYGEAAADLIACAAGQGVDPPPGTDFPGVPPPLGGGVQPAGPRGRPGQAPVGGLVQEVADIWARAIRDGAAALDRNLGGGGQGSAPKRQGPGS